jgi:hypothetical protein
MGGSSRTSLAALLVSGALATAGFVAAWPASAQSGCPPEPPYGEPAFVVAFEWSEPVRMDYGVATRVASLDVPQPNLHQYTSGDVAIVGGGCGDPIEPILITRQDKSQGQVSTGEQAVPGVGTRSVCGTGHWAGMRDEYGVAGEPWTYTLVVVGTGPCEGSYEDSQNPDTFAIERTQAEAATVRATVRYYPALSTVPSAGVWDLSAEVGVLNAKSLENARFGGDYERPPPVALATLTLPPVGSGGVGQVAPLAVGGAPEEAAGDAAASAAPRGASRSRDEQAAVERRQLTAIALLLLIYGGPEIFLDAAMTGDWVAAMEALVARGGAIDSTESVKPPTRSPPRMSKKARRQDRQWVWLPVETPVRRKGATKYLKPGVWYQTKLVKAGDRAFFDEAGKLIGRTGADVQVKLWGKEAEGFDYDLVPELPRLLSGVATGSWLQGPVHPPPPTSPARGGHWVYVTLPAQTYSRDPLGGLSEPGHVLMPGRWYQGSYRASKGRWTIWTTDGRYLGTEPDEDFVRVSPSTPLPTTEPDGS